MRCVCHPFLLLPEAHPSVLSLMLMLWYIVVKPVVEEVKERYAQYVIIGFTLTILFEQMKGKYC